MIAKHAQFLAAISSRNLVRLCFYSKPDSGTIDRECMPLGYGPAPGAEDVENRYWIWDPMTTAGTNPLGLLPAQIITLDVLGKSFNPERLPVESGTWKSPSS